jgi:predicted nuclease of restriction endonuclease-like (RecB) superfamily
VLEQQVRLSDKEAMIRVKNYEISTFIGEIKCLEVFVGEKKRKKVNKSLFYIKQLKNQKTNYNHKVYFKVFC